MPATFQYNGLVLLHAYLQRVYVYCRTLDMLEAPTDPGVLEQLSPLLDQVRSTMTTFDKDLGLTAADGQVLRGVVEQTRSLVQPCLPCDGDSPQRQLASVVSVVYAEEHVNNGIISMGDLMDPDMADRFRQQTPFFRHRVAMVSGWVQKAVDGRDLTPEESAERDTLLAEVTAGARGVEADLRTIAEYLAA
jgi:hypothetical protein